MVDDYFAVGKIEEKKKVTRFLKDSCEKSVEIFAVATIFLFIFEVL